MYRTRKPDGLRAAAANGAALLDAAVPGWWRRLDVERLDIAGGDCCVLGQLYGCYYYGIQQFARDARCWPIPADADPGNIYVFSSYAYESGFLAALHESRYGGIATPLYSIEDAWAEQIRLRRWQAEAAREPEAALA